MATDRFAAVDSAFKAGDFDRGLELFFEQVEQDPKAPAMLYVNVAAVVFRHQRFADAERVARAGVAQHPKSFDLWNLLGVALRRQDRREEALQALEVCRKIDPKNPSWMTNMGNIHNDMRNGPAAVDLFTRLVRLQPSNAENQRSLGRAYRYSGDSDKALMRFNLAVKLKPTFVDAWLDLTSTLSELAKPAEALEAFDRALAAAPGDTRLMEGKIQMMRVMGMTREAEAWMLGLLPQYGEAAWLHHQIGQTIADYDRERANQHFEKALALAPERMDIRIALVESLARSRYGDEAAHLERSYALFRERPAGAPLTPSGLKVATEVLSRVADFDAIEALGDFTTVGRIWAEAGKHAALFTHLARVKTMEDRLELVEMHRIWGRLSSAGAARRPIRHPAPRTPDGKVRVGFMSSDLRNHPVGYFAMPLFEHYDRDRFEVYCYSFAQGTEDPTQARMTELVTAFRWRKDISDRDAAQMIADDQLDMLIELGGSTHMNKPHVMAYRPAPLSGSWVGYPHSLGLSEIDYLVLDPYMTPTTPGLLIEKPLVLPHAWYSLDRHSFRPEPAVNPQAPVERNGFVTFGTANNPFKYNREVVRTWARVVAQVPDSRFLFIRPEGGSESFRENIRKVFAAEGVAAERVQFQAIRGRHLPFYNDLDISLDCFPQTGGTTTCESLWMGVPVVALKGEAVFERISYSMLENVGLGDLCATSVEDYIAIAKRLAADPARIGELRRGMRDRLKASPLGDAKGFSDGFFGAVASAVASVGLKSQAGASSSPVPANPA